MTTAAVLLTRSGLGWPALAVALVLVGCRAAPPAPPPAVTVAPRPTATPAPTPTPVVDPIAAVLARQADLRTFRQALALDVEAIGPTGRPVTVRVWAEGESARPDSRLQVGTDALGVPIGFVVLQIDRQLYLNPFGTWLAVEAQAVPAGLPLIPIPLAADPGELLPLLTGGQVAAAAGVPVRGAPTDVLRVTLPPAQAEALAGRLVLGQTLRYVQGTPTYTGATGELAVGREDGFVRRVALTVRGYSDGDPARAFAIESRTELWDVNDPTIAVAPPSEPVVRLPGAPPGVFPLPGLAPPPGTAPATPASSGG